MNIIAKEHKANELRVNFWITGVKLSQGRFRQTAGGMPVVILNMLIVRCK